MRHELSYILLVLSRRLCESSLRGELSMTVRHWLEAQLSFLFNPENYSADRVIWKSGFHYLNNTRMQCTVDNSTS